jgi:hypothetical protein
MQLKHKKQKKQFEYTANELLFATYFFGGIALIIIIVSILIARLNSWSW